MKSAFAKDKHTDIIYEFTLSKKGFIIFDTRKTKDLYLTNGAEYRYDRNLPLKYGSLYDAFDIEKIIKTLYFDVDLEEILKDNK